MIRLTPEVILHIKKKAPLRLKIQAAINASHNTMTKYLYDNDVRLTALDAINIIVEDLQRPLSELVTGGKVSKLLCK